MCAVELDYEGKQVRSWIADVSGTFSDRSLMTVLSLQWKASLQIRPCTGDTELTSLLREKIRPYTNCTLIDTELEELARKMARGLLELYQFDDYIRRVVLEPLIRRPHVTQNLLDEKSWPQGRHKMNEVHAFAEWFANFWVNDLHREPIYSTTGIDRTDSAKGAKVRGANAFVKEVLTAVTVVGSSPAADLVVALRDLKRLDVRYNRFLLLPLPSGVELANKIRGPLNKKLREIGRGSTTNEGAKASIPAVGGAAVASEAPPQVTDGRQSDRHPQERRPAVKADRMIAARVVECLDRSARSIRVTAKKCGDAAQARRLDALAMALEGASLLERSSEVICWPDETSEPPCWLTSETIPENGQEPKLGAPRQGRPQ